VIFAQTNCNFHSAFMSDHELLVWIVSLDRERLMNCAMEVNSLTTEIWIGTHAIDYISIKPVLIESVL